MKPILAVVAERTRRAASLRGLDRRELLLRHAELRIERLEIGARPQRDVDRRFLGRRLRVRKRRQRVGQSESARRAKC